MAKKKNGNKMLIAGAVLGAVAGAAYALWKTPMSGQELRGKLASGPAAKRDDMSAQSTHSPGIGGKILSTVEQTLAPLVGVELGKTANGESDGTETEKIVAAAPKQPAAPFKAADAEPAPGSNVTTSGTDTIRGQRFAWGSPTPEAAVQPTPAEPMEEDPITEPAQTREPAPPSRLVPPGDAAYGQDTIRAKRFTWGEPAPDAAVDSAGETGETDQPRTDQLVTAGATTATDDSRPVEAVSDDAAKPGSNMRRFPKLGGLE